MTTEFVWTITSIPAYLQESGHDDVVFRVNWRCVANEPPINLISPHSGHHYTATSVGSVPVTYTAGTSFTPYADLTQEQIWGWINPSIDRSEVEANLQAMIDTQKTPPVVNLPLPWSN